MKSVGRWLVLLGLILMASPLNAAEAIPDGLSVVSVSVFPERVELSGPFATTQLLVTGQLESGETIDLNRMSTLHGESQVVSVTDNRMVRAKANGRDALHFSAGGFDVKVDVEVSGYDEEQDVHDELE